MKKGIKDFKEVVPGDIAISYSGEEYEVVTTAYGIKGVQEMAKYDSTGALECMDNLDIDSKDVELVGVASYTDLDFNHLDDGVQYYVFVYGLNGAYVINN